MIDRKIDREIDERKRKKESVCVCVRERERKNTSNLLSETCLAIVVASLFI